jgi:hypothetical protein
MKEPGGLPWRGSSRPAERQLSRIHLLGTSVNSLIYFAEFLFYAVG